MLSERKNTVRPACAASRIVAVVFLFCLGGTTPAQERESQNPLSEEAKNRKVEPPRITEEDQVKLWVEGVPWFRSMEEEGPIRNEADDPNEHTAYCYTLVHAHRVPADLLAKHSIKDVPFANIVEDKPRKLYRFEPVHFEGRLVQILRVPKVPQKVKDSLPDLKEYYEGWLFPKDDPNGQPICIQFTELPKGMEAKGRCDYWVAFDGYYFKLMKYRSEEKYASGNRVWRLSPLLIGHAPRFVPSPDSGGFTFGGTLVPAIVGLVVVIAAVTFGLTYWFRQGDREVRQHLATPKANPFTDETHAVQSGTGWADHGKKD
jgi:hypothetical protein